MSCICASGEHVSSRRICTWALQLTTPGTGGSASAVSTSDTVGHCPLVKRESRSCGVSSGGTVRGYWTTCKVELVLPLENRAFSHVLQAS